MLISFTFTATSHSKKIIENNFCGGSHEKTRSPHHPDFIDGD